MKYNYSEIDECVSDVLRINYDVYLEFMGANSKLAFVKQLKDDSTNAVFICSWSEFFYGNCQVAAMN